jgi:hypothetical protein
MVTEGMFYFLSRPRRFGKSLLVSTLEHLFRGNKKLFKGLWIEKADWDWKPHPVLKIDFNDIAFNTPEILQQSLVETLYMLGKRAGVSLRSSFPKECFSELIKGLFKKHRRRVVVLIDEYDQPWIDHLGKGHAALKIAKQNQEMLHEFYGVIKASEVNRALEFVFLTGISNFVPISIFSGLNNLENLTMRSNYAAILGFTQEELESFLREHIQKLRESPKESYSVVLDRLKTWYGGYRFTEENIVVYNPVSVLNALEHGKFGNYWFEAAMPTFLINLIKERQYPVPLIETLELTQQDYTVYDVDDLKLEPFLFQTGCITIKDYEEEIDLYHLGYPNQEIKTSFLKMLKDA